MGYFSWITMDTNKSISNAYSSRNTFPVTMSDNQGNKWTEEDYNGYGKFSGKDYYELLAEMNDKTTREEGITLSFSQKKHYKPNLNEDEKIEWIDSSPENCIDQGYFY